MESNVKKLEKDAEQIKQLNAKHIHMLSTGYSMTNDGVQYIKNMLRSYKNQFSKDDIKNILNKANSKFIAFCNTHNYPYANTNNIQLKWEFQMHQFSIESLKKVNIIE